ncbi:MAG: glycosyltransferase family 2 protein [Ruminococcaceae bacterium]|nr:glycosyltransferase family 2 protein [Oscillospiraceae bacterium]
MNDLISIIIPIYNRQNVIEDCINSIKAQTFQNYEILLIDDGSTDNTLNICEKLSENNNKIKLFKMEHKGVSAARNKGLDEAIGEYVFFIDSDDIIHPNLLEALVNGLKSTDASISGTRVITIPEKRWEKAWELIEKDTSSPDTQYLNHEETLKQVFTSSSPTPLNLIGGVMMKRELIGETRFKTDLYIGEDFYFIYQNLIKGAASVFLKQVWYYSRWHSNNISKNYDFSAFWTRFYRRKLVWQSEEAFGRYEYAKRQKNQAFSSYLLCSSKAQKDKSEVKKMRKVIKEHKKDLLSAKNLKGKLIFLAYLYLPFTQKIHQHLKGKKRTR